MEKRRNSKATFKAELVFLLYQVINYILYIFSIVLWPKRLSRNPKKICIFRIGNIGDVICTIPALIAIRKAYPDAHITLLTSPGKEGMYGAKELIRGAWFINRLLVYHSHDIDSVTKTLQFSRKLRSESYDLFIVIPVELWNLKIILRNMLFAKLCGPKKAVGFKLSTIKLWAREQSNLYMFDNEVERLIKVLKSYNLPVDDEVVYDLPLPDNVKESAEEIMSLHKINGENLFGFVPGAKYQINQWPLDYFVEVGEYILNRFPKSKIVILGGPEDIEKGEYITNRVNNDSNIINLAGKTTLLELAYLLRYFKLIISNNTGPMHMAALGGNKVIGIFSSAELFGKWFPYGDNSKTIMNGFECEGCYYNCSNDKLCMKAIKPESIKRQIDMMMQCMIMN